MKLSHHAYTEFGSTEDTNQTCSAQFSGTLAEQHCPCPSQVGRFETAYTGSIKVVESILSLRAIVMSKKGNAPVLKNPLLIMSS
jgi:hypothetical protein